MGHGKDCGKVLSGGDGFYCACDASVIEVGFVEEFEVGRGAVGGDDGFGCVAVVGVHDDGDSGGFQYAVVAGWDAGGGVEVVVFVYWEEGEGYWLRIVNSLSWVASEYYLLKFAMP